MFEMHSHVEVSWRRPPVRNALPLLLISIKLVAGCGPVNQPNARNDDARMQNNDTFILELQRGFTGQVVISKINGTLVDVRNAVTDEDGWAASIPFLGKSRSTTITVEVPSENLYVSHIADLDVGRHICVSIIDGRLDISAQEIVLYKSSNGRFAP